METQSLTQTTNAVIASNQLIAHWQGHRKLTRKVIESFPEDKIFTYSIGGMRPFSAMIAEITDLTEGGITGIVTGQWKSMDQLSHVNGNVPKSKAEILEVWDNITTQIDTLWPLITPERFQQTEKAFGMYEDKVYSSLLYLIDNEIHHRAQAYVYLRSLGITPPPFWERY